MNRTLTIACTALALAGCHDFTGDLGQLGFRSNLRLGAQAWTPEAPIAAGSTVEVRATAQLGSDGAESEDTFDVQGDVTDLHLVHTEQNGIVFTAGESPSGTVVFAGDTEDRFTVRFAEPTTAELLFAETAFVPSLAEDWDLTGLDLIDGTVLPVALRLWSQDGEDLGWNPDQLVIDARGPVTVEVNEEGLLLLTALGIGEASIALEYAERPLLDWSLRSVDPAEVVQISTESWTLPEGTVELPLGWTAGDDRPVLGLSQRTGERLHEGSVFYGHPH